MNNKNIGFFWVVLLIVFMLGLPACSPLDTLAGSYDVSGLKQMDNLASVVILGSGPAGLSAAIYAARAGFQTIVFEGSLPGGLLTQTTAVENWPGYVSIEGPDIIKGLKEQASKWGVVFIQDTIENVNFTQWPFVLTSSEGNTFNALTVILATGATPRLLGIAGEQEYWGRGVTTCAVCDAPFFKGQDVVVVGGGDSAAEEAIQLAPYASHITILVRKDSMRASKVMQDHLKEYKHISIRYNVEVKEIKGDGNEVTGIMLYDNKAGTTEPMATSGVFLAIGHIPNTAFLGKAIALTQDGHIELANRTQETSVKGVFAAGDVADMRYRQAGVAAGNGIAAALDATFFLNEIGYSNAFEKELARAKRLLTYEKIVDYEVPEINTMDQFQKVVLDSQKGVIVDFYADWCSSCMQMLPAFAAMASEFEGKVECVKVDANQAESIMQAYHVQKLPTILAFKDGHIVARFAKALTKAELTDLAQMLL